MKTQFTPRTKAKLRKNTSFNLLLGHKSVGKKADEMNRAKRF